MHYFYFQSKESRCLLFGSQRFLWSVRKMMAQGMQNAQKFIVILLVESIQKARHHSPLNVGAKSSAQDQQAACLPVDTSYTVTFLKPL
jgi:hypothetical protein